MSDKSNEQPELDHPKGIRVNLAEERKNFMHDGLIQNIRQCSQSSTHCTVKFVLKLTK
jgi:hypothetical protein